MINDTFHQSKECELVNANTTNEMGSERCFRTGDEIIEFNGYHKVNELSALKIIKIISNL